MTLRTFIPARCLALAAWLQRHPMLGLWTLPARLTEPVLPFNCSMLVMSGVETM